MLSVVGLCLDLTMILPKVVFFNVTNRGCFMYL